MLSINKYILNGEIYSAVSLVMVFAWLFHPPGLLTAADIETLQNADIHVHRFIERDEGGVAVDWSAIANRIITGRRRRGNKYYDVYSSTPEGFQPRNLTLSVRSGKSRGHDGDAAWHPDGEWFVFTSQNSDSSSYTRSVPGIGENCNLWVGHRTKSKFWQLTHWPSSHTSPRGVCSPHFSPNGKKLFWAGSPDNPSRFGKSQWGERALFLADFNFDDQDKPAIANEQVFQPGTKQDFYDAHGFSPDGNKIIFSGNLQLKQPVFGMDLYAIDRRKPGEVEQLTDSEGAWDQFAAYSPRGNKIAWMSSQRQNIHYIGRDGKNWHKFLISELWIMDADGRNPRQLTHFNTRNYPEYKGTRCYVGDCVWSPDGTRIAMLLNMENRRTLQIETRLYILELDKGRPVQESDDDTRPDTPRPGTGKRPSPGKAPDPPKTPTW